MSTDRRQCVEQDQAQNCLSYTRLKCRSCAKNFVLSENFYLGHFAADNLKFKDNLYDYLNLPRAGVNFIGKKFCRLAEVSHCLEYISTRECRLCEQGYILTVVAANPRTTSAFWRGSPKSPTARSTRTCRSAPSAPPATTSTTPPASRWPPSRTA